MFEAAEQAGIDVNRDATYQIVSYPAGELVESLRREGRRTGDWNELAVDRSAEMRRWVAPLRERAESGARVLAYFNNHYAGYAPGSAEQFVRMWVEG